jgi:hypothetical protein
MAASQRRKIVQLFFRYQSPLAAAIYRKHAYPLAASAAGRAIELFPNILFFAGDLPHQSV